MVFGGIPFGGADALVVTPASPTFLITGYGGDAPYYFGVGGDQ
jgi:hypothetical protein